VFGLLSEELARQREAALLAEAAAWRLRLAAAPTRQGLMLMGWRCAAGRGLIALGTRLAGNGGLPGAEIR
jgi:hypothetical protein